MLAAFAAAGGFGPVDATRLPRALGANPVVIAQKLGTDDDMLAECLGEHAEPARIYGKISDTKSSFLVPAHRDL